MWPWTRQTVGARKSPDENGGVIGQLTAYETRERWVPNPNGKRMLTWVLYPPKFNSTKVYPAIKIFLGGPQGL